VVHAGLLKRANLVKRGSKVEIIANFDGLDVRMRGEALADGGRGDRIRVKNLSSGRVVTGTVSGSGVVHVMN
jgi:flagella basal body P-ring formation protein FlgA